MQDPSTSRRRNPPVLQAAVFLCGLFALSCATRRPESSGFLPDYERLERIDGHENALGYYRPDLQRGVYDRLLVDHVQVLFERGDPEPAGDNKALANLTASLQAALILALQERFALVTAPGPGVLRVRAAVTHIRPGRALLGVVPTGGYVLPFDLDASCLEAHLIDSATGESVASLLDTGFGRSISWGRAGENWQQPREVFRSWAAHLEDILRPPAPSKTFAGEN